jgi:hypothetical protein
MDKYYEIMNRICAQVDRWHLLNKKEPSYIVIHYRTRDILRRHHAEMFGRYPHIDKIMNIPVLIDEHMPEDFVKVVGE